MSAASAPQTWRMTIGQAETLITLAEARGLTLADLGCCAIARVGAVWAYPDPEETFRQLYQDQASKLIGWLLGRQQAGTL